MSFTKESKIEYIYGNTMHGTEDNVFTAYYKWNNIFVLSSLRDISDINDKECGAIEWVI